MHSIEYYDLLIKQDENANVILQNIEDIQLDEVIDIAVEDGNIAWYSRTFQGFTFMRVHDAGHMVPLDQPLNALDMLDKFLNNQPFV